VTDAAKLIVLPLTTANMQRIRKKRRASCRMGGTYRA
jgi:hypothetical protein